MSATEVVNQTTATEKSDRLQRCLTWVQDCKRAVDELRSEVKAAISNREKCCMVLSAAMAACLALESVKICPEAILNIMPAHMPILCCRTRLLTYVPCMGWYVACHLPHCISNFLCKHVQTCLYLVQLVYSGRVDSAREQQLQRLCAKVTSTVDLAGARVKVALSTAHTCLLMQFFATLLHTLLFSKEL